jgi:hypothetical protein
MSVKASQIEVKILDSIVEDKHNLMVKSNELMATLEEFNENQKNDPYKARRVMGRMDASGLYVQVQPKEAGDEVFAALKDTAWTIDKNVT